MSKSTSTPTPLNIKMTRTIHPVGQGAFYSETFSNEDNHALFTAVYDCGGKYDAVIREIKNWRVSAVDILFISHFHCDHINGIKDLIKNKAVKKVFFPHISPCRFLVDYMSNIIKDKTGACGGFLLDILPHFSSTMGYNRPKNSSFFPGTPEFIPVSDGKKHQEQAEGSFWAYDAIYEEDDSKERKLIKELASDYPLIAECANDYKDSSKYEDIASLIHSSEDFLEKVKKAYSLAFPGGHNSYSMLVLSHQIGFDKIERMDMDCLYTGDTNVDNNVLNVVSTCGPRYIQVPHHGSNHNHEPKLYNGKPIAFISVGETNRYRHPGLTTLLDLYDRCMEVHIVTEDQKRLYVKPSI